MRSFNTNVLNLLSNTEEEYHGLGLCEWCWYGQTKKVGRKSRRRSLLLHITSSNRTHYNTPRCPAVKMKIFMQDNASVHIANNASVHIAKKNLQFLDRNITGPTFPVTQLKSFGKYLEAICRTWYVESAYLYTYLCPLMLMICFRKLKKFGTTIPPISCLKT